MFKSIWHITRFIWIYSYQWSLSRFLWTRNLDFISIKLFFKRIEEKYSFIFFSHYPAFWNTIHLMYYNPIQFRHLLNQLWEGKQVDGKFDSYICVLKWHYSIVFFLFIFLAVEECPWFLSDWWRRFQTFWYSNQQHF